MDRKIDSQRREKLIFRWSLVFTCLIALFWAVYYFVNGSVPAVNNIQLMPRRTITLPFEMSRLWDMLMGPILFFLLIFAGKKGIVNFDKLVTILDIFQIVLICLVPIILLGAGGLIISLGSGLTLWLISAACEKVAKELGFGLSILLIIVVITGLVAGLITGLVTLLIIGLAIGLIYLVKFLASSSYWQSMTNWLLAR